MKILMVNSCKSFNINCAISVARWRFIWTTLMRNINIFSLYFVEHYLRILYVKRIFYRQCVTIYSELFLFNFSNAYKIGKKQYFILITFYSFLDMVNNFPCIVENICFLDTLKTNNNRCTTMCCISNVY